MILPAWRATFVRRWHSNPDMCEVPDYLHGHQGRVALLALILFPDAHGLHRAAILHDMGEHAVGDVSSDAKRRYPALKAALDAAEADAMDELSLPACDLGPMEEIALRICDRLDAMLMVKRYKPELLQRADWMEDRKRLMAYCWSINRGDMWRRIEEALDTP